MLHCIIVEQNNLRLYRESAQVMNGLSSCMLCLHIITNGLSFYIWAKKVINKDSIMIY